MRKLEGTATMSGRRRGCPLSALFTARLRKPMRHERTGKEEIQLFLSTNHIIVIHVEIPGESVVKLTN